MVSRPSSPLPLLLEFPLNTGDTDGPSAAITAHAKEDPHAVQNDHARANTRVPGAASAALQAQDIAPEHRELRAHAEIPAPLLDGPARPGTAGERPEAALQRSPGAGGTGPAGDFVSRFAAGGERLGT